MTGQTAARRRLRRYDWSLLGTACAPPPRSRARILGEVWVFRKMAAAVEGLNRITEYSMRRPLLIWTLAVVFSGSFLLTLWFTDLGPKSDHARPGREQLADRKVSDYSELSRVASDLGLALSRRLQGAIDGAARNSERDVTYWGWLADPDGDATPLKIVVFVAGRAVATGQTKGERADLTRLLGLAFGAEKNVAFEVKFGCRAGEVPVMVGLGPSKQYFPLPARPCP